MIWYAILALLLAGYLVLGGIDYGVGLSGGDPATVRPYFLGNQVWVVALVGVLVGAFPHAEDELLGGHYALVSVILAGLVAVVVALLVGVFASGWTWLYRSGSVAVAGGLGAYFGLLVADRILAGAVGAVAMIALMAAHGRAFAGRRWWRFTATSVALVLVMPIVGFAGPVLELGDAATLRLLAFVVVPLLPVLLGAQTLWWRIASRYQLA